MEKPYKGKAKITENINSVTLEIPPKRQWFAVIFLSVWLCGWFMGEIFALTAVFGAFNSSKGASLFILFWLIGWTAGGFMAIRTWLWMVAGKEIVDITKSSITIKKRAQLFHRTKTYDMHEVRNFIVNEHYDPNTYTGRKNKASLNLGSDGPLQFEYGMKTIKFGSSLDPSEAKHILNKLNDKRLFGFDDNLFSD